MTLMHWSGSCWKVRKDRQRMVNNAYLYNLYCEDRLIGKNKVAAQIADLMGISIEQVTAYAKTGKLIHGRYKVVRQDEKVDAQMAMVLQKWDKIVEPFRHVEWVKELRVGVRKLEVKRR